MKKIFLFLCFILMALASNVSAQELKKIDANFESLHNLCDKSKTDLNEVEKLLKSGVTINKVGDDSYTPLTVALYHENVELAKLLIKHGADVNQKDDNDKYPLNQACRIGEVSLVKLMVSKGADVNCTNKKKYTPLIYAVNSGSKQSLEIVKLLVEKGANVNAATEEGYTPLILAGWEENGFEIIKYLVSKKANINARLDDGRGVGNSCASLVNLECYKFLDKNKYDFKTPAKNGETPLHSLMDIVTCDNRDKLFFYSAIMEKESEIAEIIAFLSKKCDINAKNGYGQTVLHLACQSLMDYTKIIEPLIKNGADVNAKSKYGQTPIFYCRNVPQMVQLLIDSGADLSIKDEGGKSKLDRCEEALKSAPELAGIVEILKANSKNKKEYTFVQLCEYNYTDKALEMLKKGNVKGFDDFDANGYTPLYYAVINKNLELAKAILDKGADINKRREKDSSTVLYYAVKNPNAEMVKLLLQYKPDLAMKYQRSSSDYKANIIYACTQTTDSSNPKKAAEVLKMLLEAGADPNSIIEDCGESNYTVTVDCCLTGANNLTELLIEYGGNPFKTFTSYIYGLYRYETFSIVRKDLQNNSIYYDSQNAVFNGLIKYYKDKTLVATDNLRLRSCAGRSFSTVTAIKKGTKVKLLDAEKMEIIDDIHSCWVKVEVLPGGVDSEGKKLTAGTSGWCFLGYLEEEK